jgi:hypothetical protein
MSNTEKEREAFEVLYNISQKHFERFDGGIDAGEYKNASIGMRFTAFQAGAAYQRSLTEKGDS